MKQIEKHIDLSAKDFVYRALYAQLGSFSKWLFPLFLLALFVGVKVLVQASGQHTLLLWASALPFVMYLFSTFWVTPKNAAAEFANSSYAQKKPLCKIDAEHVSIERSSGNLSEIRWKDLAAAWENRKYFYFHITEGNVIILPKRQLEAAETTFVREMMRAGATPRARKNPYRIPTKRIIRNSALFLFFIICIVMVIWAFFYAPELLPESIK